MLLTYSSRDISKKSLRIDLFDFFNLLKRTKKYVIIKLNNNKENKKDE